MKDLSLSRRCKDELELLGYMLSAHPLAFFDTDGCLPAREIPRHRHQRVKVAGWMIAGKIVQTKGEKRQPMKFLSLEDETATFEATLFPKTYARYAPLTLGAGPLLIYGRVEDDLGALTVVADKIEACLPKETSK